MYDLPVPGDRPQRQVDPCPLSTREVEVLKRLAEGKVYKQIAHELDLSTSTVRTHLHNIYGKLGAVDRAQAVLLARARGPVRRVRRLAGDRRARAAARLRGRATPNQADGPRGDARGREKGRRWRLTCTSSSG